MKRLRTFLSELATSNAIHTQVPTAAAETNTEISTVQTLFSELVNEGVLQAKIEVRCPHCDTHHGTFERQSLVPENQKHCFVCGNKFKMEDQLHWEVIYEIVDPSADFFPGDDWHLKRYLESEKNLTSSFFQSEFERLRNMNDRPQERGRQFDYFMGLLFHQLEGTKVSVKDSTRTGEVDVYVSARRSPDWLTGLIGQGTILENKWQQNSVQVGEVDNFHTKAQDLAFPCYIAYFVSINGFSKGGTGALAKVQACDDPRLVDFTEDDVIEMVDHGTPKTKLQERELV